MTRLALVTRLALRELWMSFRLIVLLGAYLGAGAVVALLPAATATVLERLALTLAAASVVGCVTAAWSLSTERALGRVGWLAARSIERGTILAGWFIAISVLTAGGLLVASLLGWAAAGGPAGRVDAAAFAWSMAAIGCGALVLIAVGLMVGAILEPRPATLASALVAAGGTGVAWTAVPAIAIGVEVLALLPRLERPVAVALQAAGGSLTVAVVVIVFADLVLGRVDL